MDEHQMCAAAIKISRSRHKDQKSSDEEENAGDNEGDYGETEGADKVDEGAKEALDHNDYQRSGKEGRCEKTFKDKESNHLETEITEVQKSSDEEEADDGAEDDEEHCDETKYDIKEEPKTSEQNIDQIPEDEGQNIKSCGGEEKSHVLTEPIKKEEDILPEDTSNQEGQKAEVCAANNSELAIVGNHDRTSGRLLNKFAFFKRKSSKRKNERNCDGNKLEALPQSEGGRGSQPGISDDKSKDENQNHTITNQRELQPANQNRKTSSTCIVL